MYNFSKNITDLRPVLVAMSMCYTKNREDAEDLVQDVMIKVILNEHKWDSNRGTLLAWTGTVLRNMFIDNKRADKRKTVPMYHPLYSQTVQEPAKDFDEVDDIEILLCAIERLPKRMRHAMNRRMDGVSYNVISDELGCHLNNTKAIIHRAKNRLKSELK